MSAGELSALFFLQLAVILTVCRLVGAAARRLGQPQVVGEMIAGVLLGPSLFGLLAPSAQAWLFPPDSRPILFAAAQLGLALYMFLVGLEFRAGDLRVRWRGPLAVSAAGVAVPFVLGGCLALNLVGREGFFAPGVSPAAAAIFLGSAMAITAFPMLARIIRERGLAGTRLGTLALAAGASDDAIAWALFAIVLAGFRNDPAIAAIAIGGGIAYGAAVFLLGRPLLRRVATSLASDRGNPDHALSAVLILLALGAWFTDVIGLYAVFGAFVLGLACPRGPLTTLAANRLEPLTVRLLLPLFFVYSGLHTRLDLLVSREHALVAVIALAVAILGKGVACWAAARLCGESPRDSLAVGALMNARGLMELILLNLGLQAGIIHPPLFSTMVLMAVITTLMATPLFTLALRPPR